MSYVNNNVLLTGSLASSAVTADQVIATYTVPSNKIFNLGNIGINVRLTTFATTATLFGTASLMVNGTKVLTFTAAGPGVLNAPILFELHDLPFAPGDVVKVVCTPAAATAFTWEANLDGALV